MVLRYHSPQVLICDELHLKLENTEYFRID